MNKKIKLHFELPSKAREVEAKRYIEEFIEDGSHLHGTAGMALYEYDVWLALTLDSHNGIEHRKQYVPASTYFAVDDETNTIVGMVNIRHVLNDNLINTGSGHIGYGVLPSQRRKGYGTEILRLALLEVKSKYQISRAMVGCDKRNIGSQKVILNNGGVLQKKIVDDDKDITYVYTIKLD